MCLSQGNLHFVFFYTFIQIELYSIAAIVIAVDIGNYRVIPQ